MYCRKCGKQIDYDSEFCIDCRAEEAAKQAYLKVIEAHTESSAKSSNEAQQAAPAQKGARMFGFKRALTSTIMGFASIVAFYVSFVFLLLFLSDTTESASTVFFIIVFFIPSACIGVALCIISLIFGIKSITVSRKRYKEGFPTPIATLVLGIVGTYLSVISSLLFSYILLILDFAIFL
ncbi:MAG: hypothetical protein IJV67_03400 [Clostridia bacterium]|nr:hypothetical protein [Clostridia bacterium]